ncbi:MAG TPA: F0F1 ATP synthase subunit B [Mariprofundaceae bacterium]|nr:F0F1 ATP synthase subunit B [Mariprofundaceae bacterium]
MPQFDTQFFESEILWTLVVFALFVLLLKRLVIPKIVAAIETRTRIINEEIEQAKQLREDAEHLHMDYVERLQQAEAEANRMFDESEKKARERRNEMMLEWKQEMQRRKKDFHDEVELSKRQAMREIQARSADLIVDAAEKVLRKKNRKTQTDEAVRELLESLEQKAGEGGKSDKN